MELNERVRAFTAETLEAMGLPLEVEINDTPDGIRVEISGDGGEALLRRDGPAAGSKLPSVSSGLDLGPKYQGWVVLYRPVARRSSPLRHD